MSKSKQKAQKRKWGGNNGEESDQVEEKTKSKESVQGIGVKRQEKKQGKLKGGVSPKSNGEFSPAII